MEISELPYCLLIEIISRLPTTEEAIRTGALSKRWQHLWPYVSNLRFTYDYFSERDDFCSLVDKTLARCCNANLNKFKLCVLFNGTRVESTRIISWIRFAITHNVQNLDLTLGNWEYMIKLDESFFTNSCFSRLSLKHCNFNPNGEISWRNLKSLSISRVDNLSEDFIQNILSGSPLLETLELDHCYGFRRIDITSRSVTKFVFSGYSQGSTKVIEINLAYLVSLTIEDQMVLSKILTIMKNEIKLDESFFINSCFSRLSLKRCNFNPNGEIRWRNLKSLSISGVHNLSEDLIQTILSGSPMLETLVLEWCYGFRRVDITSKSVKKFMFSGYSGERHDQYVIEINAPYLVSLTIRGKMFLTKILLLNVASLVKAELYYAKEGHTEKKRKVIEEQMLKVFLLNLSHVKELKIGNACQKALSRLEAKGFTLPSDMKYPEFISPSCWKCL